MRNDKDNVNQKDSNQTESLENENADDLKWKTVTSKRKARWDKPIPPNQQNRSKERGRTSQMKLPLQKEPERMNWAYLYNNKIITKLRDGFFMLR
ncbi:Hypothetical protein FKW44_009033 [Caligus rogercresseyi]|uniref:Uncharacterized protein n=1 Tax=Caligus rogercresseyi TaxID=217165 RepID=A0A7T8K802_CALRO|nr:Hypothetical protein FKW44_009033 [Caligus rogercresseyi]